MTRKPKPRTATATAAGEDRPPAATVEQLRRRLLHAQRRVLRRVDDTGDQLQSLLGNAPAEVEEEAQESNLVAILARLGERDRLELDAIAAALARIVDGTYGECVTCAEPIPTVRLLALPTASTCVECAERQQRQRAMASVETPVGPLEREP